MSCCGRPRTGLFGATKPVSLPAASAGRRYSVQFEYLGSTGLTAIGPITGNRYRFVGPGAVVAVDPRDRPGLAALPKLRAI